MYYFMYLFSSIFLLGLYGLLQFSSDTFNGTYYLINATILPFLIIWVIWVLINSNKDLEKSVKLFFFTTVAFSTILLVNHFNNLFDKETLVNTIQGNRLGGSPTFPFRFNVQYDPVSLGVILSNIFPLFFSYTLFKLKKHMSGIYFLGLGLIVLTIFLSGTRSAWIVLVISSFFLITFGKMDKDKSKIILTFLILLAIIYNLFSADVNKTLFNRVESLQRIQSADNFLQRLDMFNFGIDLTLNNPFGIGFGRLNRIIMNEHNFYTFLTLGTGILGLFLYMVIILIICYYLIKSIKDNNDLRKSITTGGLGVLLAFLINGFADASIMEVFQTDGVFIAFGLVVVSYKLYSLNKKTSNISNCETYLFK